MKRWLPFPLISVALLALWLLLNQSLALGHFLLGGLLALLGPLTLTALQLPGSGIRRPKAALKLAVAVFIDIVRSNIAVARIILLGSQREETAGFMSIPLQLRDRNALAALACIITSTPGTLWVDYDSKSGVLLLHVLDLVDEEEWMDLIKGRYERMLMEVFE